MTPFLEDNEYRRLLEVEDTKFGPESEEEVWGRQKKTFATVGGENDYPPPQRKFGGERRKLWRGEILESLRGLCNVVEFNQSTLAVRT